MKIFQILENFVHWTTPYSSLAETEGKYAPNILFVEAPDYVFEGWGYDPTKEGDERFIQPTPPEGWEYDPETGTFFDPNASTPEPVEYVSADEVVSILGGEEA